MKHGDTGKCTLWINFHYRMSEYGPTALSWKCYNLHTGNSLTPSGCLQNTNTVGIGLEVLQHLLMFLFCCFFNEKLNETDAELLCSTL